MSSEPGIDTGRFGRTLVLIGFVTTVFLFLIAERLSGDTFRIGAIAIGTVALITAITGFLIAAGSAVDAT
ncbi:hypothetical protein ABNG03_14265 [Halorubrum sp. RMP-47]|uniref:Major facilitator superfamily (MFS) profile domain-containing protein n=1 Tax=Halorubrum miltondacostae TaxID=3076378 RepID=A0ABD5M4I2_9EURY